MEDNFYRAFEERHYAPREIIKTLRKQYLPFVTPLLKVYPGSATFDVGCGRGEWLELMTEIGFKPLGIDIDQGMLHACLERNLPAKKGDAIEFISCLEDESQAIVSAFHVVEHISFDQLMRLVREALRVLKPGGLLIMETPNPENIAVATCNFYIDPTHHRPIPPQLLSFLPEYCGFARIKTLRLQESKELVEKELPTLNDVFYGASPDYAVIAQKGGHEELFRLLDQEFNKDSGLTLKTLADRFEARVQKIEEKAQQAEAKAMQAEAALQAIYQSRSWRVTAPLRWLSAKIKRLVE